MERCAGERGKGFFWSVDPAFDHMFEEQVASVKAGTAGGKKKEKGGASLSEPPLKRSVKGDPKGATLPPPLTSTPRPINGITPASPFAAMSTTFSFKHPFPGAQPTAPTTIKTEAQPHALVMPPPAPAPTHTTYPQPWSTPAPANRPVGACPPATTTSTAPLPTLPRIPFLVAPLPPSYKSPNPPPTTASTPSTQPNPNESLVLHEGALYLHPTIFADLTPEHLTALEALGMQRAIEVLKGHIVNYLREVGRREGRGRGRGRVRRGGVRGRGGGPERAISAGLGKEKEGEDEKMGDAQEPQASTISAGDEKPAGAPVLSPEQEEKEREESPIVIVDDDEEEVNRATKRRKLYGEEDFPEMSSV